MLHSWLQGRILRGILAIRVPVQAHVSNEGKGRFRILRHENGCWFLRPYGSAVFL